MASKDLSHALAAINFELTSHTFLAGTQQPSLADCAAVSA
jgi:glutathione S-transferase